MTDDQPRSAPPVVASFRWDSPPDACRIRVLLPEPFAVAYRSALGHESAFAVAQILTVTSDDAYRLRAEILLDGGAIHVVDMLG